VVATREAPLRQGGFAAALIMRRVAAGAKNRSHRVHKTRSLGSGSSPRIAALTGAGPWVAGPWVVPFVAEIVPNTENRLCGMVPGKGTR
jgi:hypothetical protein